MKETRKDLLIQMHDFPFFIQSLPEIELPIPGVCGQLIQSDHQQVVFVRFHETVEFPEHTHEEQWEIPLAGKVRLHIGGASKEYHPGDNFFIPAHEPHAATVFSGYMAIIIFNSPDRYKLKR